MRSILILVIILWGYSNSYSQYRGNNWVFGDSIYMHFNGNSNPVLGALPSSNAEAYASISDSLGDILFYCGTGFNLNNYILYIYDRLGNPVVNSNGIFGFASATQGCIIIPMPGSFNLFYIFSNARLFPGISTKAFYNIIDINQNGGLGAITLSNQVLIDSALCEMMTAVKHANGRDWWLVLHQHQTSNYLIYLITPSGISGPMIQSIGIIVSSIEGQAVFSKSGDKFAYALTNGNLQLMDFDRCSGLFTNCVQLGDSITSYYGYYGCSFSNNASKLYASYGADSLFQFDLYSFDIKSSRFLVYTFNSTNYGFGQHLLGEDDKIYLTSRSIIGSGLVDSVTTNISVVDKPDSLGAACSFLPFFINTDSRLTYSGLPNNPNYALGPVVGSICDSLTVGVSEEENDKLDFKIYPNPARDNILIRMSSQNKSELQISDLSGKIVKIIPNIKNNEPVSVADLSNGIYIVSLKMKEQFITLKMVVIH